MEEPCRDDEPILISNAALQALHDALSRALASVAAEWPEVRVDRVDVHIPAGAVTYRFTFDGQP